jgi:CcmD family protein
MIEARNFTYMFYGFAAAFVILVVYVVSLALRERRLRSEIDRVRRMVEDTSKKV